MSMIVPTISEMEDLRNDIGAFLAEYWKDCESKDNSDFVEMLESIKSWFDSKLDDGNNKTKTIKTLDELKEFIEEQGFSIQDDETTDEEVDFRIVGDNDISVTVQCDRAENEDYMWDLIYAVECALEKFGVDDEFSETWSREWHIPATDYIGQLKDAEESFYALAEKLGKIRLEQGDTI